MNVPNFIGSQNYKDKKSLKLQKQQFPQNYEDKNVLKIIRIICPQNYKDKTDL